MNEIFLLVSLGGSAFNITQVYVHSAIARYPFKALSHTPSVRKIFHDEITSFFIVLYARTIFGRKSMFCFVKI